MKSKTSDTRQRTPPQDLNPGTSPTVPLVTWWLSGMLLLLASVASGLTFFAEGILSGTAAMNGSARGTAVVFLVVTIPVMAVSMGLAAGGSTSALVGWLGALGVTAYNAQMFLYATPFNQLFLLDVAMLALAIWSIISLQSGGTVALLAGQVDRSMPVRWISGYLILIALLNALLWLATIVPAVTSDSPGSFLDGTGLLTNPVFVQDLAIWLPLAAVGAVWLWNRKPWGFTVAGGVLVMWVIESISVAADQWFGSQADPGSTVVAAGMVPAFGVLALVGLLPLVVFLRHVRTGWVTRSTVQDGG